MTVQTSSPRTEVQPAVQRAERCTGCGNPLALDQRYCLNCGKRRGGPRIEFERYLDQEPPAAPPQAPPAAAARPDDDRPEREVTPLMAAAGLTAVAVILILGVLIGRTGQGDSTTAAPVMATTGLPAATTPGTTTTTATTVSFVADWPAGQEGFTVELATLPKDSSDAAAVETAKADLAAQGATDVGALDSDEYASLPPGNYVLYSGVFDTKADADAALEPLKATFPDAQVVEVSAGAAGGGGGETETTTTGGKGFSEDTANIDPDTVVEASEDDLEQLDDATGDEYQEIQKKLPPTIETPGAPPPKDDKAPGGGSGAVEIG